MYSDYWAPGEKGGQIISLVVTVLMRMGTQTLYQERNNCLTTMESIFNSNVKSCFRYQRGMT